VEGGPEGKSKYQAGRRQLRLVSTGGKGKFTQWVHCEFFVNPETIRLVVTQQVCGGFF
jgi:hypothetical protein